MKKTFKKLCRTMLTIGAIGFGGGSALIPVMHKKLRVDEALVQEDEFNKDVSVAMLTPGALPVEISAGVGYRVGGIPGFFAAPFAISLPGVVLSLCLCALFSLVDERLLQQFGFLSMAITPFIIAAVMKYILSTFHDAREPMKSPNKSGIIQRNLGTLAKQLLFCALAVALCGIICALCIGDMGKYVWLGAVSSITSFGGGDAYLAIAEGMFVTTGLLASSTFYSVVIPVVNAVPGSILCKTLTCIGFFLGLGLTGTMWAGFAVALCGFFCSIAMSCATYAVGGFFMESFEKLRFFHIVKILMRVIISALQLKVIWKLASSFLKKGSACGYPIWTTALLAALLVFANLYLPKKFGLKPFWIILASVVICLVFGNVGLYFFI